MKVDFILKSHRTGLDAKKPYDFDGNIKETLYLKKNSQRRAKKSHAKIWNDQMYIILAPDIPKSKTKSGNMLSDIDTILQW